MWTRRLARSRLARAYSSTAAEADVIVVGGGHAGCEAAAAAARLGAAGGDAQLAVAHLVSAAVALQ